MSGLDPSPTVKVRRTTTSRLRIELNRTAVTISSRIDYPRLGRGEVARPRLIQVLVHARNVASGGRI
jgi:hypothetical protein